MERPHRVKLVVDDLQLGDETIRARVPGSREARRCINCPEVLAWLTAYAAEVATDVNRVVCRR